MPFGTPKRYCLPRERTMWSDYFSIFGHVNFCPSLAVKPSQKAIVLIDAFAWHIRARPKMNKHQEKKKKKKTDTGTFKNRFEEISFFVQRSWRIHFWRLPHVAGTGREASMQAARKWSTTLHPTRSPHNKPRCLVRHGIVAQASFFFTLQPTTSCEVNPLP